MLLRDKKNNKILGSIRFNYMIPVPMKCLHKLNIAELSTAQSRAHASKELAFCRRNRDRIYKTAKNTYMRVLSGTTVGKSIYAIFLNLLFSLTQNDVLLYPDVGVFFYCFDLHT